MRPLQLTNIFSTTLWRQTRGLLLYGPPGTGKTMLGKVLKIKIQNLIVSVGISEILRLLLHECFSFQYHE